MYSKIKDSVLTYDRNISKNDKYKKSQEVIQALTSLGFDTRQAKDMISSVEITDSNSVEDIIKMALSQK